MNDPVLKLNLLVRSEMTLARIHTRKVVSRIILSLIALVFGLLGLGMLNFSIYQVFATYYSASIAGGLVALINLLIAILLFIIAAKAGDESNEEKMAEELRDLIYSELTEDAAALKAEFAQVINDVHRIRSGFSDLTSGKIGGLVGMVPLFELLNRVVQKKKKITSDPKK